jgi:hypothetical protein
VIEPNGLPRVARVVLGAAASCVLVAGCGSGGSGAAAPEPSGPPSVQPAVVSEHADQFDDSLAERPAGSQQEFAAATYILGHLQSAGYVPLLDPVPVEDTVRSTNVVAAPPRGKDVEVVVAVAYDTARAAAPTGAALGAWLEVARALYARAPDHSVEFVALGAEHSEIGDGELGSRRLVEFLRDDDLTPLIVSISPLDVDGETFTARGAEADALNALARDLGVDDAEPLSVGGAAVVFVKADLPNVTVSGSATGVGRVLLEYLSSAAAPGASPSGR